jgi:hypothetical protein
MNRLNPKHPGIRIIIEKKLSNSKTSKDSVAKYDLKGQCREIFYIIFL